MTMTAESLTAAAWSGPFELPHQTPVVRPSSLMEVVSVLDDDMAFGPALPAGGTEMPVQGEIITVTGTDPSTPITACGIPIKVATEAFFDGELWAVKLERSCSGPAGADYAGRVVNALIDNESTIVEHLVWEAVTAGVPVTATDPTHALAVLEASVPPLTLGDAGVLLIPTTSVPYFANANLLAYDNTRKVFTFGGVPVATMTADSDPAIIEAVWVPTFTIWRSSLDSYPLVDHRLNDHTTVATRSYLANIQRDLAVHVTVP